MNAENQEIKVKRVSSRKRSRDYFKSHLTPAQKRETTHNEQYPQNRVVTTTMADVKAAEVCYFALTDLRTFILFL